MDRELALEFIRVTEAAAIASGRWIGRGDKIAADDAAVKAMRQLFDTVAIQGKVVIGEGEMDEAPMLYIGEKVGAGHGPQVDIAVDPLEGTNLVAKNMAGGIAVLAAGPAGSLLHAPDMYMHKIAVGPVAAGKVHFNASVGENLKAVATALQKPISDVTLITLDRERHYDIIAETRKAGARVRLITDGDVSAAIATAVPDSGVDIMICTGGAPEGVLAAAALKCLGGDMQAKLAPKNDYEIQRLQEMGQELGKLLTLSELVKSDDIIFAATGITDGEMLRGVRYLGDQVITHSMLMRGLTGTLRYVEARHKLGQKPTWQF